MKKILLILALTVSAYGVFSLYQAKNDSSTVKAYGTLTVNFHSTLPGNPVFDITNFLPGQSTNKNIDVKNDANNTEVFVKGIKKSPNTNPKLENVLDLKIAQGSSVLYSKKLSNFFNDDKISLGKINKNQSKTYNFNVTFETSAGNEYQGKSVKFDMDFSSSGDVKGAKDENNGKDNHKKDFNYHKFDLKRFADDCRSNFQKFFKFGHR
jgi:hypothetical protein